MSEAPMTLPDIPTPDAAEADETTICDMCEQQVKLSDMIACEDDHENECWLCPQCYEQAPKSTLP